ncbi:MAG: hypothetical protein HQM10_25440 [Candidatus Riflebacteria bacterium]|nr:hypothetical protein [Candidatus Riflebacteria bacterium]
MTAEQRRTLRILIIFFFIAFSALLNADQGSFELTSDGVFYVQRDASGNIVSSMRPDYDLNTGAYVAKDQNNRVVARQALAQEAPSTQIKIVTPLQGETHSVKSPNFMDHSVPVLREMPSTDPKYQQLKSYIENSPGLLKVLSMHVQARDMKINQLQQQITSKTSDPELTRWLINDLKKPVYLEVGNSGSIYHDPNGFLIAERAPNGQITYRDNAFANRLVVPSNSEAFTGGMNDSAAASVIAHETGHMIMDQLYERPNYPKTSYSGPHSKNSITDEGFALSEGWAEAVETLSNKDNLDNPGSWRLKTQKNIIDNKYILKNQGAVDGVNDGILKSGVDQLSTEGVNATLFYKLLQENNIQAPYEKVLQVFEKSKPQTYRDFINDYVQKFPEDKSTVYRQFLETTKYTTVDSQAATKYKALFDAEQAYKANPADSRLQATYQNKLNDYNRWKEALYQKAVVEGRIDSAVSQGNTGSDASASAPGFSDETQRQFRQVKLSETILKGKIALREGLGKAGDSIKQSFSVKNVAITAGTSIAINLASQIMNGEKPSFSDAVKSVASWQFAGNVAGSAMGAAAGHAISPLIQAFVPIPIVGALAGSLLPTLASIAGGQVGGNIGAGQSLKEAFKSLDPVVIAGQGVGSTIGAMLGTMIPIPVVGQVIGGIVGGIIGEKVFKGIANFFKGDKENKNNAQQANTQINTTPQQQTVTQNNRNPALAEYYKTLAGSTQGSDSNSYGNKSSGADIYRIDSSIDRIPYNEMPSNLRSLKDEYEKAYKKYVTALSSGNQSESKTALELFTIVRDSYKRALGAYNK